MTSWFRQCVRRWFLREPVPSLPAMPDRADLLVEAHVEREQRRLNDPLLRHITRRQRSIVEQFRRLGVDVRFDQP